MLKYTKKDLENLKLFILKNKKYFDNFTSDSKVLAEEIYKKIQLDEDFIKFKNCDIFIIKIMIVTCSDIYHNIFKHSDYAHLRWLIVKHSTKYHDYFSDDSYYKILTYLAKKSDKYHNKFKDNKYDSVRYIVAKYSDKYDNYFVNDPSWRIQKILNSRKLKNKSEHILDIDKSYKISFIHVSNIDLIINKLKTFEFNIIKEYNSENNCLFISTFNDIRIAYWGKNEKFLENSKFYKKISIDTLNKLCKDEKCNI